MSADESEALAKRVQAMQEAEAKKAAEAKEAAPPEPKKVPGNPLAAALDGYKSLQNLARKLDRRRDSVERAKQKLALREQEFEKAKKNLEEAKTFLEDRELEEAATTREYLQLELVVKTSPSSVLEGDPDAQASDPTGFATFVAYAEGLAAGVECEPPPFPKAMQLVFQKYVAAFGYEKCMGIQQPKEAEHTAGQQTSGSQPPVKPELGPALPVPPRGGAAVVASNPLSPKGGEDGKGPSPATPPLRPESKKQKLRDGDNGDDSMGMLAPLSLPAGGVGLGRGLFGTAPTLTSASVAALPGGGGDAPRSRSRSRASSGSAPMPTELGEGEQPAQVEEDADDGEETEK
jgi:hypothetical protein